MKPPKKNISQDIKIRLGRRIGYTPRPQDTIKKTP